jgi:hypothetical protein
MKTFLIGTLAALSLVSFSNSAVATEHPDWFGESDWHYNTVCLDTPTNARLSPEISSNNIRAVLVDGTCGNPLYSLGSPVLENEFYLIEFYFANLGEWRRYWIHESQIESFYLGD